MESSLGSLTGFAPEFFPLDKTYDIVLRVTSHAGFPLDGQRAQHSPADVGVERGDRDTKRLRSVPRCHVAVFTLHIISLMPTIP